MLLLEVGVVFEVFVVSFVEYFEFFFDCGSGREQQSIGKHLTVDEGENIMKVDEPFSPTNCTTTAMLLLLLHLL